MKLKNLKERDNLKLIILGEIQKEVLASALKTIHERTNWDVHTLLFAGENLEDEIVLCENLTTLLQMNRTIILSLFSPEKCEAIERYDLYGRLAFLNDKQSQNSLFVAGLITSLSRSIH